MAAVSPPRELVGQAHKSMGAVPYLVYGLSVACPFELGLPRAVTPVDVTVELRPPEEACFAPLNDWFDQERTADGSAVLRWNGIADFVIPTCGERILCYPRRGLSETVFKAYLFTQVISYILSLRGREALHGSAVEMDGRTHVFVGPSGMGKSTTVAFLLSQGARLISDDLILFEHGVEPLKIHSSAPRLKLNPDVLKLFDLPYLSMHKLDPYTEKLLLVLPVVEDRLSSPPIIHLLSPRTSLKGRVASKRASQKEAFWKLAQNTFNCLDVSGNRLASHFQQLGKWSSSLDVRWLSYPRSFDSLPEIRERIRECSEA